MSDHFDLVCQYGYKHGTCRCASPNKSVRKMTCNVPAHAESPMAPAESEVDKMGELYALINEFAKATGQVTLDPDLNTHEEFVLLAHNAAVAARALYDTAQRSLWTNRGRGC